MPSIREMVNMSWRTYIQEKEKPDVSFEMGYIEWLENKCLVVR